MGRLRCLCVPSCSFCTFAGTAVLGSYWMGLTYTSNGAFQWPDGTFPNTFVSDVQPYGHGGRFVS
jgi:hypothetical protein